MLDPKLHLNGHGNTAIDANGQTQAHPADGRLGNGRSVHPVVPSGMEEGRMITKAAPPPNSRYSASRDLPRDSAAVAGLVGNALGGRMGTVWEHKAPGSHP